MSKPIQTVEELDAVLHWRGKHAQAIKERDALQQLLNQRDEQVEILKMRPQGEPVAWMFKYLSHSDSPPYSSFEVTDFHQNPKVPGIEQHTPLYAEQPAPVAGLPERLQQVLKFLDGAENLDGHWFGEPHPSGRSYWWRNELRKALAETNLFAKQQ